MDEYVVMNKSDLTTMADTIRETLGSTDSIAVGDLANKLIESIEAGGGGGGDIAPFSSVVCGTYQAIQKHLPLMGFPTVKYLQCVVLKVNITKKLSILYQQYWLILKHLLRHQLVQ